MKPGRLYIKHQTLAHTTARNFPFYSPYQTTENSTWQLVKWSSLHSAEPAACTVSTITYATNPHRPQSYQSPTGMPTGKKKKKMSATGTTANIQKYCMQAAPWGLTWPCKLMPAAFSSGSDKTNC